MNKLYAQWFAEMCKTLPYKHENWRLTDEEIQGFRMFLSTKDGYQFELNTRSKDLFGYTFCSVYLDKKLLSSGCWLVCEDHFNSNIQSSVSKKERLIRSEFRATLDRFPTCEEKDCRNPGVYAVFKLGLLEKV